jgi:hypothetical protein
LSFLERLLGSCDHHCGERPVSLGPGIADVIGEGIAETLLERPQQRCSNEVVVIGAHAVAGVPAAERLDGRDEIVEPVDALDHHGQGLHEVLLLGGHIGLAEETADGRVPLEEAFVEEACGNVRNRFDGSPAGANEVDVDRGHRAALQGGGLSGREGAPIAWRAEWTAVRWDMDG